MRIKLAILAISILLTLGVVELAGRFLSDAPRFVYHPVLGYINAPSSRFQFRDKLVCTGSDGCIRAESEGLPELLVVGDSFAAGQSANWPNGCIEVLARETGIRTANFGTSGYGTDQCLLRLQAELPRHPKGVLYLLCENDLRDNCERVNFHLDKPRFKITEGTLEQTDSPGFGSRAILGSWLCGKVADRFPLRSEWQFSSAQKRADLAFALIDRMKQECDRAGCTFAVAAHWQATNQEPQKDFGLLLGQLRASSVKLLVLNEVVPLGEHYDQERWHWNESGHRLVGLELARWLTP